jgi:hypothetical protein
MLNPFKPWHGLRQGDPLSSYLFLFFEDGLSCILKHEIRSGALHELKICRLALGVSPLLFADDTLLFFEANEEQAMVINDGLRWYERCPGQLMNPAKCSILFGAACMDMDKERIKEILCVENTMADENYLSLPTLEGRLNKDKFNSTKERLTKRFTNWAPRNMSSGAKEVLIKAVAQAIRTCLYDGCI